MGFGQIGIKFQRPPAFFVRFEEIRLGGFPEDIQTRATVGNAGMGACITGINLNRPSKHLAGLFERLSPYLMKSLASLQVVVVRADIRRLRLLDCLLLA